jgi:hypothetical protein
VETAFYLWGDPAPEALGRWGYAAEGCAIGCAA